MDHRENTDFNEVVMNFFGSLTPDMVIDGLIDGPDEIPDMKIPEYRKNAAPALMDDSATGLHVLVPSAQAPAAVEIGKDPVPEARMFTRFGDLAPKIRLLISEYHFVDNVLPPPRFHLLADPAGWLDRSIRIPTRRPTSPYMCGFLECLDRPPYRKRGHLEQHEITCHSAVQGKIRCSFCPKWFNRRGNLRQHTYLHTLRDQPYSGAMYRPGAAAWFEEAMLDRQDIETDDHPRCGDPPPLPDPPLINHEAYAVALVCWRRFRRRFRVADIHSNIGRHPEELPAVWVN
ncbi:Uu.00g019260.m01.CDS01 [Anthostomella pinea]|uniref:Uu.00g019260.m01.CDS01 n=1 Tax=Anthostomella pinea TaxID=933095 RepID=A0AAI8VZA1_9PEZI|nr:Uu.00g019260.m01.CDS01 [Anthostomella pinea]